MDDRSLVTALRSGDLAGLAGVYDAYADRLLAYAATLLRDRDAAADAVHDTMLIARERIGQLREPDRLRPWLYAIVRNECLRQLRDRRRAAPLEEAGEVIDESAADLGAGARAAELRELVWAAAAALNPGEREVLELSVRHGLEGADLADALGTGVNVAHARNSRARDQLERSLGALLVARSERGECAELDALLAGWDGTLTPLLRKRLARHADRCEICGETRRHRLNPVALLAGVPFLLAPPGLREQVLGAARPVAYGTAVDGGGTNGTGTPETGTPETGTPETGSPEAGSPEAGSPEAGSPEAGSPEAGSPEAGSPEAGTPARGTAESGTRRRGAPALAAAGIGVALAERAGPWQPDGFPRPLDARRRTGAVWWSSAAALLVLALLVAVGLTVRSGAEPTAVAGAAGATLPVVAEDAIDPAVGAAPSGTATGGTTGPTPPATGTPAGPTTTRPAPTGTPGTVPPPTPSGTPPPVTRTPTVPPTVPPTTQPAPPPAISIDSRLGAPACPRSWRAVLVATVTGTTATSVSATYDAVKGKPTTVAMQPAGGGSWSVAVSLPAGRDVPWRATASTEAGRLVSAPGTLRYDCPRPTG